MPLSLPHGSLSVCYHVYQSICVAQSVGALGYHASGWCLRVLFSHIPRYTHLFNQPK